VSTSLNDAGTALYEVMKCLTKDCKTIAAKKLADSISHLIENALQSVMDAETMYERELQAATAQPPPTDTVTTKLDALERGMQEIKAAINEGQKSWANIVATPLYSHLQGNPQPARKVVLETFRKERNKYEVTLDIKEAPDHIKAQISEAAPAAITKALQYVINAQASGPAKPTLNGVNKLANDNVRMQFKTQDDARRAREGKIDWSLAYKGVRVYKPKYGIVVNRVPANAVVDLDGDYQDTAKAWSEQNKDVDIVKITRLRRRPRAMQESPKHQSLVVFTEDKEAANHCIKFGFFIDHCKYRTERYVPHLHVNQCFRCYGFGHRAATCKHEEKCGRCGDVTHTADKCGRAQDPSCVNCKGSHEAWHARCPKREEEQARLEVLKAQTPPFYQ
jgi:hypothetical protein